MLDCFMTKPNNQDSQALIAGEPATEQSYKDFPSLVQEKRNSSDSIDSQSKTEDLKKDLKYVCERLEKAWKISKTFTTQILKVFWVEI